MRKGWNWCGGGRAEWGSAPAQWEGCKGSLKCMLNSPVRTEVTSRDGTKLANQGLKGSLKAMRRQILVLINAIKMLCFPGTQMSLPALQLCVHMLL